MNTLTAIEAERVDQILQHAHKRLEMLSAIPTSDDEALLQELNCLPVSASLDRLWMAENQLAEIYDASSMGGRDMFAIKQAHRAVRAVCRNILADKTSYEVIMNRREVSTQDYLTFNAYLAKLRGHVKSKLMTTVEDESANRVKLLELTEKVRKNEEIRDLLQSKYDALREEKEKVTTNLDQILRKLQHEKEDLNAVNQQELDLIHKDTSEAIAKATGDHEQRMRQLQDTVDALEKQLSEAITKNRLDETQLRKDKSRAEKELNAKIAQYDDELETRRKSQEALLEQYEAEKAEYAVLKEHFDEMDSDNALAAEEELILGAVRRREEFAMGLLNNAASKIAALFLRRFSKSVLALRKDVEKARSKGKKGKKGGKKGKK